MHPAQPASGPDAVAGRTGAPAAIAPLREAPPAMTMSLTDLDFRPPGLARLWHGLGLQERRRFLRRVWRVGWEVTRGTAVDLAERGFGKPTDEILRIEEGVQTRQGTQRIALYAHYAASGQVSAMVLRQLRAYRDSGFSIVFVTMSPGIDATAWAAVRDLATLVVHRRNHGLDFGAWQALAGIVARRWPDAEELLLTNDSVLGPIRPLEPVFAALRTGGEGLFGLTDSRQGGSHLQSYFLLARGRPAVAETLAFFGRASLSTSKWMMVRRCEIGLSRHMHVRGFRVAALFGYSRLIAAVQAQPAEGLAHLLPERATPATRQPVLPARPLNPVHHLWRPLVCQFGFPFVKTELVRRNPGWLPQVDSWPSLVGPDSPCPASMLATHLAEIGP